MQTISLSSEQLSRVQELLIDLGCETELEPGNPVTFLETQNEASMTPTETLGLNARVYYLLKRRGIDYVEVLQRIPSTFLSAFKDLGPKSLENINERLLVKTNAGLHNCYDDLPLTILFDEWEIGTLSLLHREGQSTAAPRIVNNLRFSDLYYMGLIEVTSETSFACTPVGKIVAAKVAAFAE